MVDTGIVRDPSVLTVWVMGAQYPVSQIFSHPGGWVGGGARGVLACVGGWVGACVRACVGARRRAPRARPGPRLRPGPWAHRSPLPPPVLPRHAGYSPARIPEDNRDLTFDGPLHDLAVIKLAAPVPGSPATAALAPRDAQVAERQRLQVAGWGTTEAGTASNLLK